MPSPQQQQQQQQHNDDDESGGGVEMTVPNADGANSTTSSSDGGGTNDGGEVYTVEAATDTARNAIHRFFYPKQQQQNHSQQQQQQSSSSENGERRQRPEQRVDDARLTTTIDTTTMPQEQQDTAFVHHFWTAYDDILILSIFTQVGILFRLASSTWFTFFDGVFSTESPLFVNLPLNCLSCFIMGVLCSGERLMEIICTRFTPPRTQQTIVRDNDVDDDDNADTSNNDDDDDHDDGGGGNDSDNDLRFEDGILDNNRYRRRRRRDGSQYHYGSPSSMEDGVAVVNGLRRRRRRRKKREKHSSSSYFHSWQPPVRLNEELRDVQLLALERRIRMSKCLVLFPVKKEDVDVMEHYFREGYKKRGDYDDDDDEEQRRALILRADSDFDDLVLAVEDEGDDDTSGGAAVDATTPHEPNTPLARNEKHAGPTTAAALSPPPSAAQDDDDHLTAEKEAIEERQPNLPQPLQQQQQQLNAENTNGPSPLATTSNSNKDADADEDSAAAAVVATEEPDYIADLTTNVQENVDRLRRVNLADGWDSGTTPEAMSDDLMLGLRDGFCGALSSFSSWNSSMVTLMRQGQIGEAFVGYMLGLQLPIIAYRFGQHVAVYIFIWRTRRETRVDERRGGYGIRVAVDDEESDSVDNNNGNDLENGDHDKRDENDVPSVRAVVTAIFIMALVTQCTSLTFFRDPADQQTALSLLFSPLGVLARWRLSKYNRWRPNFPIGTFTANLLACALSGSLGSLLAGNPGPRERIVLVSVVAGFGGTLSSLANFVVEILAGIDPILFRFDGIIYAVISVGCAMVIGFIFSASVEWADETRTAAEIMGVNVTRSR